MTADRQSIETYRDPEMQERFASVREQVLYIVRNAQRPSSSDIMRIGGLSRNTVTGRLKELEEDGLIYKADVKLDPFTHRMVNWYAPRED